MIKKIAALLLALSMLFTLCACGGDEAADPGDNAATDSGTADSGASDAGSADKTYPAEYSMQTSDAARVVNVNGEVAAADYAGSILVTSFGQSADGSMLNALMKRIAAEFTYLSDASAEECAKYDIVLIACGASTKGLGAAGISESDERARADEIVAALKESGAKVIACHLGGSTRRGNLSDGFTNQALEAASYMLVVEEGNTDYLFTKASDEKSIPMTLLYQAADAQTPLTQLFGESAS